MNVGMIARAEDRGLGILTWEFARHVRPARTLLIDMGALSGGFDMHVDRYPDATIVPFDGVHVPDDVRDWLVGLDVLYSAETFYDWRIVEWARELGVTTVCHAMPEFFKHGTTEDWPHPDAWWNPTSWRMSTMPDSTRLVPVPVALERWPVPRETSEHVRVLHVVGKRAMADRNGTTEVMRAAAMLRSTLELRLIAQERRLPSVRGLRRTTTLDVVLGGVDDYWSLYDADVLLLPRRYGGLSLPVQEAMGAGLAVVMTDAEPQSSFWPVTTVQSRKRASMPTGAGPIDVVYADVAALARQVDRLVDESELLLTAQTASRAWAVEHSWDALLPLYVDELTRACSRS